MQHITASTALASGALVIRRVTQLAYDGKVTLAERALPSPHVPAPVWEGRPDEPYDHEEALFGDTWLRLPCPPALAAKALALSHEAADHNDSR